MKPPRTKPAPPIRQWCNNCQAATPTRIDMYYGLTERCARCEPPGQRELWDPWDPDWQEDET